MISLETLSFVFGSLLLLVALVGGKIEIKELKLPEVGRFGRVFAFVLGLMFVSIGVGGFDPDSAAVAPQPLMGGGSAETGAEAELRAERQRRIEAEQIAQHEREARLRAEAEQQAIAASIMHYAGQTVTPTAQPVEGLTGNVQAFWQAGGVRYEAVIEMQGYQGAARVSYIHPSTGLVATVIQGLTFHLADQGAYLIGSNPSFQGMDPGTGYSPDNFLLQQAADGSWQIVQMCDLQGVCAQVHVQAVY